MDVGQLPELSAEERYTSLFVQEDEPFENLRPKKANPFEECSSSSSSSSSSSEDEAESPQPRVQPIIEKPPLIIVRPTYGNQYKPPPPPPTKPRSSTLARKRAEDIKRAGAVLDAAFSRHATSQRQRAAAKPLPPHTVASTLTSDSGEYVAPPADSRRDSSASETLSPGGEAGVGHCKRLQSPRRPQWSGDTASRTPRRLRSVSGEQVHDPGEVMGAGEAIEAASILLSLYNDISGEDDV